MTRIEPLIAAALALGSVAIVPAAAEAQRYGGGYSYQQPYRDDRYAGGYYDARGDDGRGYDDRRASRRCNNGTAGALIGALAGGLLGRAVDNRGDHAVGTILGAGAGALAGRAVGRSGNQGYCR